jgi:DNA sulfur modification protein DndD
VFGEAIDLYRDELRKTVEKKATDIFRSLTSDKTYTGLSINDQYGLTILDRDGNEVPVRSAGAEQIVALSLVGALNKSAVRSGPIIMDTPFGRLDPTHRENILKFLPTLSAQVTLLVHGGEVDRTRDLGHIKDKIDREYSIDYVTSSRSRLSPVRE